MHRVIGERSFEAVDVSPDVAREFLTDIVRARVFDERAVALQRRGWLSGYPPFKGQEGSQVGAAHALGDEDWLFPTYRANAMQLVRGRSMAAILQFRRGRSEFEWSADADRERGTTFPQATPIGTHLPHAVGAGLAAAHLTGDESGRGSDGEESDGEESDGGDVNLDADGRDQGDEEGTDGEGGGPVADHAVCAYFGDGATSEGDFHEAMNFAGVFDAPVVFLCENNHWAISMPAERQTASETIAGKASAYGFEGIQVDGNDPLAVYEVVRRARESALAGAPVLVESLTYRQGAHTTSDDPDRYRGDVDLPDWRTADPLDRYEAYLREEGVVDETFVPAAREAADEAVDEAVAAVEAAPDPDPADLFAFAYADLPPRLSEQRRVVGKLAVGESHGDGE